MLLKAALAALVLLALAAVAIALELPRRWLPQYRAEDVVYSQPITASLGLPSGAHNLPDWNAKEARPSLSLSSAYHDFGVVPVHQKVQWVFAVANRGSAALAIRRAYTTCECTTATFTAGVIPPGKVSLVTVTFDPSLHGEPGATVRRGVIFETDDPAHPQAELWIQARLR